MRVAPKFFGEVDQSRNCQVLATHSDLLFLCPLSPNIRSWVEHSDELNGTQSACPQSTTPCPSKQEVDQERGYLSLQHVLLRTLWGLSFMELVDLELHFPESPFPHCLGCCRKKRSRNYSPQKCQWWSVEITWKVLKEASLFSLVPAGTQSFPCLPAVLTSSTPRSLPYPWLTTRRSSGAHKLSKGFSPATVSSLVLTPTPSIFPCKLWHGAEELAETLLSAISPFWILTPPSQPLGYGSSHACTKSSLHHKFLQFPECQWIQPHINKHTLSL